MSDFETVHVGTMEELKRVKEERDEAFAKGKQVFEVLRLVEADSRDLQLRQSELLTELAEAREREQTMAALCEDAAVVLERTANDTIDGRNMARRLRGATDTSLARLKAEWQAEVLEVVAEDGWSDTEMLLLAAQLRRQAEGDEYE